MGDFILVKLQPYRQSTVAHRVNTKLSKHFFGPFPVIAKVGLVAYTLQLPATSRIHPTFHVSQLKLFKGSVPSNVITLPNLSVNNYLSCCLYASWPLIFTQLAVDWLNRYSSNGLTIHPRILLGKIYLSSANCVSSWTLRTRSVLKMGEVLAM